MSKMKIRHRQPGSAGENDTWVSPQYRRETLKKRSGERRASYKTSRPSQQEKEKKRQIVQWFENTSKNDAMKLPQRH